MKKLFALFAFLLASFAGFAQTEAKDSTLLYPVTVQDARFVAGVMPAGSPVVVAIAKAVKGISDTGTVVNVTVKQSELVQVANNNRMLPEGVAADVNLRLFNTVIPLMASRPWLAQQMLEVRASNQRQVLSRAADGAVIIQSVLDAWNRK